MSSASGHSAKWAPKKYRPDPRREPTEQRVGRFKKVVLRLPESLSQALEKAPIPCLDSSDSDPDPPAPDPRQEPILGGRQANLTLYTDRHLNIMPLPDSLAREFFREDPPGTHKIVNTFPRASTKGMTRMFLEPRLFKVGSDGRVAIVETDGSGTSRYSLGGLMALKRESDPIVSFRNKLAGLGLRPYEVHQYDANGRVLNPDTLYYVMSHPDFILAMTMPMVIGVYEQRAHELNSVMVVLQTPEGARVARVKNLPCRGFHHMLGFLIAMFRVTPPDPDDYQALLCRRRRRSGAIQVVGDRNLHTTLKLSGLGWQLVVQPRAGPWERKYLHRWGVSEELYRWLSAPFQPDEDGVRPGQVVLASHSPPGGQRRREPQDESGEDKRPRGRPRRS